MIYVGASVEGATERDFVSLVLNPYLQPHGLQVKPIPLYGGVSLARARKDIRVLGQQHQYVTTLYDYYGFQGRENLTREQLEQEISAILGGDPRLIPYVQKHEFEALPFAGPAATAQVLATPSGQHAMEQILREFPSPEDINDGYDTCPSRRLRRIFPSYQKALHGPLIASAIGIVQMRNACPGFDRWIGKLISLTTA